jgi:prepilin-type N-terminal cleavage/methylation domain-containing protein
VKNTPKQNGFTIIELLVVIVIIIILSSIGLVSFLQLSKNARDTKRITDLKQIQAALEQYRADNLYYPPSLDLTSASVPFLVSGTRVYLNDVPKDPRYNSSVSSSWPQYCYVPTACNPATSTTNCKSYHLYTQLEAQTSGPTYTGCTRTFSPGKDITPP